MSAWVLPDHIADVLPSEARHIEELRRSFLDKARTYGYELVTPPLMEHLDSLLSGDSRALDLQTFKLVDQLSGRSLGIRADTTPQVARLDAHLLNRSGVARLSYCGPILHTRPDCPHATREPLQFGAEIYGHDGVEAEHESVKLALACVQSVCGATIAVDLNDVQVVGALLDSVGADAAKISDVQAALAHKDGVELRKLCANFPAQVRQALVHLPQMYGDVGVIAQAQKLLSFSAPALEALKRLEHFARSLDGVRVSIDLSDLGDYAYYSGLRFGIFVDGVSDALVRGGRYDKVGSIFGRSRPAVGFSLDIKQAASIASRMQPKNAIRAPFDPCPALALAIDRLRAQGCIVVCLPSNSVDESMEFSMNQELFFMDGQWVLRPLTRTIPN